VDGPSIKTFCRITAYAQSATTTTSTSFRPPAARATTLQCCALNAGSIRMQDILWANTPIKQSSMVEPELRVDSYTMIGLTMQRWMPISCMRQSCTNGLMDILGPRCIVLGSVASRISRNYAVDERGQGFLDFNTIKYRRSWRFDGSLRHIP
jgi:hypothetical protein